MAEVTGALPFAGGSYGLARCTLGFFPAFVIGVVETMEYITSVAIATMFICDLSIQIVPSLDGYQLLIWAIIYVASTLLQILGGRPFWITLVMIGVVSLVIVLVYCFGCLGNVDFNANAVADPTQLYIGGMEQLMALLPYSSWSFIGIEILNLASDDVDMPKSQIPRGQVACMGTLFVSGLFVLLVTVSLPIEGGLASVASVYLPLSNGFTIMFNASPATISALMLPPMFGALFGLSWAHTKLIHAMADSKLFPTFLAKTSNQFKTPHSAIIVGAFLGYLMCLTLYFYSQVATYLFLVCFLFAFMSYAGQCIGYISLKLHYPLLKKSEFKNPFGIVGAMYSLFVWILSTIGVCFFSGRFRNNRSGVCCCRDYRHGDLLLVL